MKLYRLFILLLFILTTSVFMGSQSAQADDADIPYAIRIPYRIVRGITNIGLGWTEMLLRPIGEIKTEKPLEAFAHGAGNALARLSAGATDITTFWVPDIQMLELYPDWQGWPYLFHWS